MSVKRTPGERIAELRKTYSVTLETLAERSGLDVTLIRRIEEGGFIPDLAPLLKISRALGVRLGTLLDDHEELGPVLTRKGEEAEGVRFITGGTEDEAAGPPQEQVSTPGHRFHALAADKGSRHMEPFIVDIEADSQQPKTSHEGEEFIYVLKGAIVVDYGKSTFTVNEGDSIYYDSIVPHRVTADNVPARILAVIHTPA